MITVYGRATSLNVQAVMWTHRRARPRRTSAATYGLNFGGNDTPEYRAMNPNGLVPTLQDEHVTMFESAAIVRYLAARYGRFPFWPEDPVARAPVDMWAEWGKTTLQRELPRARSSGRRSTASQPDARGARALREEPRHPRGAARRRPLGARAPTSRSADIEIGLPLYRYFTVRHRRARELPAARRLLRPALRAPGLRRARHGHLRRRCKPPRPDGGRLRHRRLRLRRLGARLPAGRGGAFGARARVRRHRLGAVHPDAGGALLPDEHGAATTGAFAPSPSRTSAAGGWPRRAARCSAARPRSTAWSTCAAIRATSTAGRRWAPTAGPGPTCCPTSSAWRTGTAAQSRLARHRRAAARDPRAAAQPALPRLRRGRARRPASSSPTTTTARSRRASGRWSRRSGRAAAGRPPTPTCARR